VDGEKKKADADDEAKPTVAKLSLLEEKDRDRIAEAGLSDDAALEKLFANLLDEGATGISKEVFLRLTRVYMKVCKETAMTAGISIKASRILRRVEAGEVVEILEGPFKEDNGVSRVRVRVTKDGLEGWATTSGNQGTVFLKPGGHIFKVVKETILTEAFDLEEGKESTRTVKETTRKLQVDELLEVYEWPRKEDKSGLVRMKAKARSDGAIGWVTTVGSSGTVFLEVF